MISGIVLFGVALGAFSSALTLRQLRSNIQEPEDLDKKSIDKPVAVIRNTLPKVAPELVLMGGIFMKHGYGIPFPAGSPLRDEVDVALPGLMEGKHPVNRLREDRMEAPALPASGGYVLRTQL